MSKVLAIDPSASAVGWAAVEWYRTGSSMSYRADSGVVRPKGGTLDDRIDDLIRIASLIVNDHSSGCDCGVIEVPALRPGYKQAPRGLATYGRAVGIFECELSNEFGTRIIRAPADRWVHDIAVSKVGRASHAAMLGIYEQGPKGYQAGDNGFDRSDAIALGLWALRRI